MRAASREFVDLIELASASRPFASSLHLFLRHGSYEVDSARLSGTGHVVYGYSVNGPFRYETLIDLDEIIGVQIRFDRESLERAGIPSLSDPRAQLIAIQNHINPSMDTEE